MITIRACTAKLDRARLVPLHPTTDPGAGALRQDAGTAVPAAAIEHVLSVRASAPRLDRSAVAKTLRTLTSALGLRTDTVHPTAHDLRHSFAVSTLLDWQRSGVSVDERIAVLSTYLGHVSPAETYWYLTATPELMDSAARATRSSASEDGHDRTRPLAAGVLHRKADRPTTTRARTRSPPTATRSGCCSASPPNSPANHPARWTSPILTRR